jgi:hypothetical protein
VICALTVRRLQPGSFVDFREAFLSGMDPDSPPEGWTRFTMLRNAEDPDEVITFGHFDGCLEDLRRNEQEMGYDEQMARIAPHVASTGTSGLFEVVVEYGGAPAG